MNQNHTREYIRHPANIPLEVVPQSSREQLNLQLNNVSEGGLSFDSPIEFHSNTVIKIKIPSIKPAFTVSAVVQWCKKITDHFEMGVRFLDQQDAFQVRMIEQVCHIGEYRQAAQLNSGRRMTWNKASIEWIEKHGGNFPN